MHQIIYMSYAVAPLTSAQLYQLLTLARQRNTELAITGILLYGNERFVQVLEGEEAAVRNLYKLIKSDARHQHVIAYANKPIKKRTFKEWAMAFQSSSPEQAAALAGYLGAADVAVNVLSFMSIDAKLLEVLRDFTLP
jgi:uncharacterized protein YaaQ